MKDLLNITYTTKYHGSRIVIWSLSEIVQLHTNLPVQIK